MVMLDDEVTPRSDDGEAHDPAAELANFMPGEVQEEDGANRGAGEEDAAVTRIQAMQRGKQARREFQEKRPAGTVDDPLGGEPRTNSARGHAVVPMDDTRMVSSDGMVPHKPKTQKPGFSLDTNQKIEELSLTRTELVKRNAELAAERRREELVAKQAQKQKLFKQMQREKKATLAAKREAKKSVRASKAKKVADFEVQQERWKDYMYQKIQSEANHAQEVDALKLATLKERQERFHMEKESLPKPKGSYLDPHLKEAGAVPGPGAYAVREQNDGKACGIGAVKAKSSLDWAIYRASKLPGPAEYSPMNSKLYQSGGSVKFSADNSKSSLDWTIHRAKQMPGPAAYSIGDQARDGGKNKCSAPRFGADESKSMIDWVIHRAKQLPGPQDYPEPNDRNNTGVRFSNARPKTDLEWTIHRAKQLPGPGEYGTAGKAPKGGGVKFNEGMAKSALDWEIYRGKQLPGPAAYFPTASHKQKMQMAQESKIKARTDADEISHATLERTRQREMARVEARSNKADLLMADGAGPGDGGDGMGNFLPA